MVTIVRSVKFESGLVLDLCPTEGQYDGVIWLPGRQRLCEFTKWKNKRVHKLVERLKTFSLSDLHRLYAIYKENQLSFWECVKVVYKERR